MSLNVSVSDGHGTGTIIDAVCPDVYFTARYGLAAAVAEPGTWTATHWAEKIIFPQVRRAVGDETADVASPYGYSGIYVAPGCTRRELARFWCLNREYWHDIGVVAAFLRFSPLLPSSVAAVAGLDALRLVRRGDTITVDTGRPADQIWEGMQGRSRTAVRKARSKGLSGNIRPAQLQDVKAGSPFRSLYEQSMARVGAAAGYLFPDTYYTELANGLREQLLLAEVVDTGGPVVASALVMTHGRHVHYHLAGSLPHAAKDGANNLLVWTIIDWSSRHDRSLVHLGGGVRENDGLFRFKTSFGGRRTQFWTGAVVVQPARYEALVAAHSRSTGLSPDQIHQSGYFPGYRMR